MRTLFARSALALAALCSCRATTSPEGPPIAPEGVESVWQFLAQKYDANGDAAIETGEYPHAALSFERLDGDQDGALTAADFPDDEYARDLTIADMPPEVRAHVKALYDARAVVLSYFAPEILEPGVEGLTLEALGRALERRDLDGDGAIDPGELERATAERPWAGPGEAWELLVAAMDEPGEGEGRLAREEFEAYHAELGGEDGVLRGPPSGWPAAPREIASDGPPLGSQAPDFALAPPDGGEPVRLSSLRGRPVALVFGSYT